MNKKSSLLLNSNPVYKKIPVLLHHGKPIIESLFIIEYIYETWKDNPILPTDPYERAMARFWTNLIDQMLHEGVRRVLSSVEGKQIQTEIKKVSDVMEMVEGMLKGKKFFGGEKIGFLDIIFGWIAIWFSAVDDVAGVVDEVAGVQLLNPDKHPLLQNWENKFREFLVVKDSLYPTEKLVRFTVNHS
ncbi:hypothetical protein PTKIN_Ptkin01aG0399700 [Pterospermum kingtungense]